MMKRTLIAIVAIFVAWSILDFFIHGLLLQSTFEATAKLWRPMEETNMPLMYLVTLAYTTFFVLIYGIFVTEKSLVTGIKFGELFGLAAGVPWALVPTRTCLSPCRWPGVGFWVRLLNL